MLIELMTNRSKSTLIKIGVDFLQPEFKMQKEGHGKKAVLILDENVDKLHPQVFEHLDHLYDDLLKIVVPQGESSKSLSMFADILNKALHHGVRRSTVVYVAGGGVTGDLGAFVAASLLRGLPLVHIPTTLLAMVDSSIGGKTGINHDTGKNLIGAFYQPDIVLMDMSFLSTLPQREWNCGMGEVLKYACISDPAIFDYANHDVVTSNTELLSELVFTCAKIKSDIVRDDELESGLRAFLNYGHTFAHALESFTGYKRFAHGEAVYIGLVAATWLSAQLGASVDTDRLLRWKSTFNLSTRDLTTQTQELILKMEHDKKNTESALRLILLRKWGEPYITDFKNGELLRNAWEYALENVDNSQAN